MTDAQSHHVAEVGASRIHTSKGTEFIDEYTFMAGIWNAPARNSTTCAARSHEAVLRESAVLSIILNIRLSKMTLRTREIY